MFTAIILAIIISENLVKALILGGFGEKVSAEIRADFRVLLGTAAQIELPTGKVSSGYYTFHSKLFELNSAF